MFSSAPVAIIAIGRNEGERLRSCLQSACAQGALVVYVDSGSIDGSASVARDFGCRVVELDPQTPFTAARGRNSGYEHVRKIAPDIPYVQFVDGDCEIAPHWVDRAREILDAHPRIAVVCGRRRERFPDRSIYNWLCDQEWNTPVGLVRSCGGDALMRVSAFEQIGGFRAELIAAEEPELCMRLRSAGWQIWRIDYEMTLHDAAMTSFRQWFRRALRAGYGFAQTMALGHASGGLWKWESVRAWTWSFVIPSACLCFGFSLPPWGWLSLLVFPLQVARQTIRNSGSLSSRFRLACFQLFARFPEALGEAKFVLDRLRARTSELIEYK